MDTFDSNESVDSFSDDSTMAPSGGGDIRLYDLNPRKDSLKIGVEKKVEIS